jgi:hypothetical protein
MITPQITSVHLVEMEQVCRDLQILNRSAYTFRGELTQIEDQTSDTSANSPANTATDIASERLINERLVASLRDCFYNQCYVRDYTLDHPTAIDSAQFIATLKRANSTVDTWDEGWKIYQMDSNGRVSVQKAERSRSANPGEFTKHRYTGKALKIGDIVSLRVYPGSSDISDSFYFAFGDNLTDQFDEFSLLRFYFNVASEHAADLLASLSQTLNYYAVPYRFKTLSRPQLYRRADGAVLYVARRYYPIVASLLSELATQLLPKLRTQVPLFCKTFLPGIGLAEDPRNGESFGMHRCRLMALGLVNAWCADAQTIDARLASMRDSFSHNGIDWEKPYLNPHSSELPLPEVLLGLGHAA